LDFGCNYSLVLVGMVLRSPAGASNFSRQNHGSALRVESRDWHTHRAKAAVILDASSTDATEVVLLCLCVRLESPNALGW